MKYWYECLQSPCWVRNTPLSEIYAPAGSLLMVDGPVSTDSAQFPFRARAIICVLPFPSRWLSDVCTCIYITLHFTFALHPCYNS